MEPMVDVFRKTKTVFEPALATAISGFPSPFKSPIAIPLGVDPVALSIFVAKEEVDMTPGVDVFRKIEIVALAVFPATRSGFPSPSKSPAAHDWVAVGAAGVPVAKLMRLSKNVEEINPVYVSLNGLVVVPINAVLVFNTVMFLLVAPMGTVTVKLVEVALLTFAFATPKKTILFAAVVLKPDPEIVTTVPTGPLAGEKLVMTGWENDGKKKKQLPRKKSIVFMLTGILILSIELTDKITADFSRDQRIREAFSPEL